MRHPDRTLRLETAGNFEGRWDEGRVGQLLSNLLGNAILYGCAEGSVTVRSMTFTVAITRNRKYLRVDVGGPTSLRDFAALVAQVAAEIERFEDHRVLLDLRQVRGRLSTSEQQLVGEIAATRFPLLYKLASIVPEGEITRNSERSAVSRGLQVRVFDSEAGALAWLLQSEPTRLPTVK